MPQLHGKQIKDTTIQGTTKLVAASVDTGQLAADAVDQTILDLAATYDFSGGGGTVQVATPSAGTDAANKSYVDGVAQGLDVKDSVRVATAAALPANTRAGNILTASANGALNGTGIDSVVTLALNDRVLVKDEATGANNGIYFISDLGSAGTPWTLTRATDADTSAEVTAGMFVFAEEGTANQDTGWVLSTDNPITLNTTALTFVQFSSAGVIVAGDGLLKTGNTLDVRPGQGIEIVADLVQADLLAAGGLKFTGASPNGELGVEPADFAGTGVEDDGADNLRIAAAAAGNGLTGGGGVALAVEADATETAPSVVVDANGVRAAVPTAADKSLVGLNTTTDGDQVTSSTVTATPAGDGYVAVDVNGVSASVGDGVKTSDCYFSGDGGTTARAIAAIVATDTLHWVGSVANFEIDTGDRIDLGYNVAA